ncbi:amidohydrolase [Sphingobacteriaceae bacterium]|nr:amidohydrolase [Sphingobacteriaceae bacterium]
MKVTLIQTELTWENREKNLEHFDALLSSITEKTDLIVLPEMFTTGFSMQPQKVAEASDSVTLEWLKKKAKATKAVIIGSVAVQENGNYYNRLFWVEPSGEVKTYDKRHLFRMAKEDEHYTAGNKKITGTFEDWKIRPLICYDLRFPVWSRNRFTVDNKQVTGGSWDYDVLIYVANWPEVRNHPWKQLLIARAIENQCYVIGVNRIGKDGNDFSHSGDSVVINPRGEIISKTKAHTESVETIELDKNYLEDFRKIFPVGLDADEFDLN